MLTRLAGREPIVFEGWLDSGRMAWELDSVRDVAMFFVQAFPSATR
jgi:hypothetical protein